MFIEISADRGDFPAVIGGVPFLRGGRLKASVTALGVKFGRSKKMTNVLSNILYFFFSDIINKLG